MCQVDSFECSILHGIRADPEILSEISSFELHKLEKLSQGLRLPVAGLHLTVSSSLCQGFQIPDPELHLLHYSSCEFFFVTLFIYLHFVLHSIMGGKSKSKVHERESEPLFSVVRVLDLPVQTRLVLPDLDMKYNWINGQKWITLVQRSLKAAYMGKHLTEDSPSEDDPKIETWESEEAYIMNWMVKNMEED